jgi:hypothetical protein
MADPNWDDFLVRSRAANTSRETTGEPNPVILTTLQGDQPHGDGTRWGGEVRVAVHIDPGDTLELVTQQIVRAQVMDHYARRWRWWLVLGLEIPDPGDDGPNILGYGLEWTVGVGTITVVQRLDMTPFVAPINAAVGWVPTGLGPTRIEIPLHDVGALTSIIGEAVAVRFWASLENPNEGPIDFFLTPKVIISPESISA